MSADNLNDPTDFGAIMIDRLDGEPSKESNPGT